MTIDNLLAESTINFSVSLTLEETEELLDYIAENLPGETHTRSDYHAIRYTENEKIARDRGTVSIGGMIRDARNSSFDAFSSINNSDDSSRISAIRFQTIPGYELEEHRPEVRQLWEDVRKQINDYFALRR